MYLVTHSYPTFTNMQFMHTWLPHAHHITSHSTETHRTHTLDTATTAIFSCPTTDLPLPFTHMLTDTLCTYTRTYFVVRFMCLEGGDRVREECILGEERAQRWTPDSEPPRAPLWLPAFSSPKPHETAAPLFGKWLFKTHTSLIPIHFLHSLNVLDPKHAAESHRGGLPSSCPCVNGNPVRCERKGESAQEPRSSGAAGGGGRGRLAENNQKGDKNNLKHEFTD